MLRCRCWTFQTWLMLLVSMPLKEDLMSISCNCVFEAMATAARLQHHHNEINIYISM